MEIFDPVHGAVIKADHHCEGAAALGQRVLRTLHKLAVIHHCVSCQNFQNKARISKGPRYNFVKRQRRLCAGYTYKMYHSSAREKK